MAIHRQIRKAVTMRFVLVVLTSIWSPGAHAVNCGPVISPAQLEQLKRPITRARANLLQHSSALVRELEGLKDHPRAYDHVGLEQGRVNLAYDGTGALEDMLDRMDVLVQIRDLMVDKRDWDVLAGSISIHAVQVNAMSARTQQRLTDVLTKLTRPGIAAEVSQLRGFIAALSEAFGNCDLPPRRGTK